MKRRTLLVGLIVAGLAGVAAAKPLQVLKAGTYAATVKALACEACGPKVVETLKAYPGVADASVDQASSRLTFVVKRGAKVEVAALQKKLKSVSEDMGMGADYTLRDIQRAAKAR